MMYNNKKRVCVVAADTGGGAMLKVFEKLRGMSDADVLTVWGALRDYDPMSYYDAEADITMDDWAEAVYSEKSDRGL